ncbi:MAG: hypothetical protein Q9225_000600 [Loekoesia sp. 1 TL-2023]
MPPSSLPKSVGSFSLQLTSTPYICPNCRFRNVVNQICRTKKSDLRSQRWSRRAASTITSVTAVNAKKDIPPVFRNLHDALIGLQHEAAVYTNLSQLQLALRGLETENGVTRVAALGGADGRTTRRLVKVLLADPLASEAEWEKQLASLDNSDGRALLLR